MSDIRRGRAAAEMGTRYTDALGECEQVIAQGVTDNLFERHMKALFLPR